MRIEHHVTVARPRQEIWGRITNPHSYRRLIRNLTEWEPERPGQMELGSRIQMRLKVGAAEVGGLIEVVEFEPPGDLAWTSVTGIDQRGRWRLRAPAGTETDVTLRLSYQSPGGILALIADRLSAPIVSANLRGSLDDLQHQLEADVEDVGI